MEPPLRRIDRRDPGAGGIGRGAGPIFSCRPCTDFTPDQPHTRPRSRRYAFASRAFLNSFFRIVRGGEGPVAGEAGFVFGALLPRP